MGQNGIPGVPSVDGLVLNDNVAVINGRPTWAFTFKLTPVALALKVCKPKGRKHSVTCMGKKDFSWPKVLSGGPEIVKQSDGLVKAHSVETILPLKGNFVKPRSFSEL